MLLEAFSLILQLPPLAFGPARPPEAFAPPWELVCPLGELGRLRSGTATPAPVARTGPALHSLQPAPEAHLINRGVDGFLLLALAYAGRTSWDTTPWSARTWQAAGGITPVLIPPLAPPSWVGPR